MKKLIVGFAIALVATASQASWLWWEVTGKEQGMNEVGAWAAEQGYGPNEEGEGKNIMGRIVAINKTTGERTRSTETAGFVDEWNTAPTAVDLSTLVGAGNESNYSYYVEIVTANASQTLIGMNNAPSQYADLSGYITADLPSVPPSIVWHGGQSGYTAAPEPTSAMLMLLGVAGLALRRKQRKA